MDSDSNDHNDASLESRKQMHFSMIDYECRLKTFKNWPFNGSKKKKIKCTAEAMAESGFYCPNPTDEPDTVCCFLCMRTLDGWEETDVPDEEHARKQKDICPYLGMKRNGGVDKMSPEEVNSLKEMQRHLWSLNNPEDKIDNYFSSLVEKFEKVNKIRVVPVF